MYPRAESLGMEEVFPIIPQGEGASHQRGALVRFHVSLSTYSYRLHSQWRSATPPCGHPVGPRVLGTVSYSDTRGTQDE